MKYTKLQIKSSDQRFDNVRWHVINYILRQGKAPLRHPAGKGVQRAGCYEEEFGTVVSDNFVYSYHVEPKNEEVRTLTIVAVCDSKEYLDEVVEKLTKHGLKCVED
jgi:hypothetical protein